MFYLIKSLILSCYLINLSSASLLVSLVVSVLFIFSLLGKINSQPRSQSVSSWVNLAFRGVIVVILPTLIAFSFLLMLPSLRIPFFSPTAHPPVSDVLSIPLILPFRDFPSPPMDGVTRSLQVYTHRSPTRPLVESSSMPVTSNFDSATI